MQQGRRVFQCPLFKVIAVAYGPAQSSDNAPAKPPVFGFIVSKKVALRANKRNRIKRRMRHLILQRLIQPWQRTQQVNLNPQLESPSVDTPAGDVSSQPWLAGVSGKAYVVIMHPASAQASFAMMAEAVDALCRRLP